MCSPRALISNVDFLVPAVSWQHLVRDLAAINTIHVVEVNICHGTCERHGIAAVGAGWKIYNEDFLKLDYKLGLNVSSSL